MTDRPTSPVRYEILTYALCDGWINCWSVDGEPETFSTIAEAEAELAAFLAEIDDEIQRGERDPDQGYDESEFAIVPVGRA